MTCHNNNNRYCFLSTKKSIVYLSKLTTENKLLSQQKTKSKKKPSKIITYTYRSREGMISIRILRLLILQCVLLYLWPTSSCCVGVVAFIITTTTITTSISNRIQIQHNDHHNVIIMPSLLLLYSTTKSGGRNSAKTTTDNNNESSNGSTHRLLQEFCIASGEVINPYMVLKVSRKATRDEIRSSYIQQSRRYHPDGYRNHKSNKNQILPGKCNNMDDVREQWERIKLSYEILSDPKTRKRYDRKEVFTNPNAAIQRAMMDATWDGMKQIGKGLFSVGSFAVKTIINNTTKQSTNTTASYGSSSDILEE